MRQAKDLVDRKETNVITRSIKVFVENGDQVAEALVQDLRNAGVVFLSSSSSGPTTVWVDGYVAHGRSAARRAVDQILQETNYQQCSGQPA